MSGPIPRVVREQIEALLARIAPRGEGDGAVYALRAVVRILDAHDAACAEERTGPTVAEGAPAHGLSAAFCTRCGGWCAGH